MVFKPGRFLIVDTTRDSRALRPVRRLLERYRPTDVRSPRHALDELAANSQVTAVLIGQQVQSLDVLAVLEALSGRERRTATALVTDVASFPLPPGTITIVYAPLRAESVKRFLRRALALEILADEYAVEAILAFAERYSLAPRETEILSAAIAGISGRDYLDATGTTDNTRKRQIQSILRKSGFAGIERTAIQVLRDALSIRQRAAVEIATAPRSQSAAARTKTVTRES